jgi:hypothetical protein
VIWFALISGAFLAVASQVERPDGMPLVGSAQAPIEGHPKTCLACRHRGRMLPAEIGDDTVWVRTARADDGSVKH